jgi:hypothetical protein
MQNGWDALGKSWYFLKKLSMRVGREMAQTMYAHINK